MSDSEYSKRDMFRLGVKIGFMLMLAVWTLVMMIHPDGSDTESYGPSVVSVYRGVGLCLAWLWLWGGNIYIWTKHLVNYVYVCEFKP